MNIILQWIEAHPTTFALIVWPIVTGILTSIFSKPSDEFSLRWPRIAALRRIPSDAGLNLPKLLGNVLVLLTGRQAPTMVPIVPNGPYRTPSAPSDPSEAPTEPVLPRDPPSGTSLQGFGWPIVFVGASVLAAYGAASVLTACAVTPSQHAANVAESTQAAAEYAGCRESAKLDGGWDAYQACACVVDKRHGVNTESGCP